MDDWDSWRRRAKEFMRGRVKQADVAEHMKVTQGQVGHWLSGRRKINLNEFFEFCEFIGADPQALLFGERASSEAIRKIVTAEVAKALADKPKPSFSRSGAETKHKTKSKAEA